MLTDHIESNPDKFFGLEYHGLLLSVRKRLAKLIGAETEECVLVANASTAASTIFHGLGWKKGDNIVSGEMRSAQIRLAPDYDDAP